MSPSINTCTRLWHHVVFKPSVQSNSHLLSIQYKCRIFKSLASTHSHKLVDIVVLKQLFKKYYLKINLFIYIMGFTLVTKKREKNTLYFCGQILFTQFVI